VRLFIHVKVEIFSDVACPWCYIGQVRFAHAVERFRARGGEIEVIHRPFELAPGASTEGEPLLRALERKFGAGFAQMAPRVIDAAAEDGLVMNFDKAVSTGTFDAHRLIEVAARQGLGHEMSERLFAAYFTEGLHVGDPEVLARLAEEIGVKDTGEGAEEVRAQLARAHALGISGVPLFLFEEKYTVSGAQPEDTFLTVLEELAERTGQTLLPPPADNCDDGVCAV